MKDEEKFIHDLWRKKDKQMKQFYEYSKIAQAEYKSLEEPFINFLKSIGSWSST